MSDNRKQFFEALRREAQASLAKGILRQAREQHPQSCNDAKLCLVHMVIEPLFLEEAHGNLQRFLKESGQALGDINPALTEEMLDELKAIRAEYELLDQVEQVLKDLGTLAERGIALNRVASLRMVDTLLHAAEVAAWDESKAKLDKTKAELTARRHSIAQKLGIEV